MGRESVAVAYNAGQDLMTPITKKPVRTTTGSIAFGSRKSTRRLSVGPNTENTAAARVTRSRFDLRLIPILTERDRILENATSFPRRTRRSVNLTVTTGTLRTITVRTRHGMTHVMMAGRKVARAIAMTIVIVISGATRIFIPERASGPRARFSSTLRAMVSN